MKLWMNVSFVCVCMLVITHPAFGEIPAQDWPQWRGANGDARVDGFQAPAQWPKELNEKWKVAVGDGVATPALVGDRLYVFSRQDGKEITRCLDANSGDQIWSDAYAAEGISGPASGFVGPRSCPAVVDGKVVTLGVHGVLSCLDAGTGKVVWRNEEYKGAVPRFATSSSPLITHEMCIVELGDDQEGAIVAFGLNDGKEKWSWTEDGPSYGSPALLQIDGQENIVVPTARNMVALRVNDGTELWKMDYTQGRYNAASPAVAGDTVVIAGPNRGMTAHKFVREEDIRLRTESLWVNADNSLQFNSPIIKNGLVFGLSNLNSLFCVRMADGQTAWTAPLDTAAAAGEQAGAGQANGGNRGVGEAQTRDENAQAGRGAGGRGQGGQGGRGGGRRERGGGGGGGYGSIVDLGSTLVALSPVGKLIFFAPSDEGFTELAKYKVADGKTYAYPVASGNRIFIKDDDSLTQWTFETADK